MVSLTTFLVFYMVEAPGIGHGNIVANNTNPKPKPRNRTKTAPSPRPRSLVSLSSEDRPDENSAEAVNDKLLEKREESTELVNTRANLEPLADNERNESIETPTPVRDELGPTLADTKSDEMQELVDEKEIKIVDQATVIENEDHEIAAPTKNEADSVPYEEDPEPINESKQIDDSAKEGLLEKEEIDETTANDDEAKNNFQSADSLGGDKKSDNGMKEKFSELAKLQKSVVSDILEPKAEVSKVKPPEVVALHPKTPNKDSYPKSFFDSYTRKRGFQIGSSLLDLRSDEEASNHKNSSDLSTPNSVASALNAFEFVDEIEGLDVEMFTGSLSKNSRNKNKILNQLHGMHDLDNFSKNPSGGSLRSVSSLPGFLGSNMKKWNNVEELDDISLNSFGGRNGWVIGDTSDTGMSHY